MELVQELFMSAIMALAISFVVTKLVLIAMGMSSENDVVFERSKPIKIVGEKVVVEEKELRVEGAKSQKRVHFAEDEFVEKIDQFRGDVGSAEKSQVSICYEEIVRKICDTCESSDVACGKNFGGGSEKRPLDGGFGVEEEIVSGSNTQGVGVEFMVNELGGVVEDKGEILMAETVTQEGWGTVEDKAEILMADLVMQEDLGTDELDFLDVEAKSGATKRELDNLVVEEKIGNGDQGSEIGVELINARNDFDDVVDQRKEVRLMEGGENELVGKEKGGLVEGDKLEEGLDDWEGIERSELEKAFAAAVNYVGGSGEGKANVLWSKLGSDVQMQLYGLHKIATEGRCHERQPMALKVSARAKWNAWQKLGNMNPEMAMEQYISILTDNFAGWMQNYSAGDCKIHETAIPADVDMEPNADKGSELELKLGADEGGLTMSSNSVNKA